MEDLKKYLEKHQFEKQFTQIKKELKIKKSLFMVQASYLKPSLNIMTSHN